jgi:hypothetical protein
LASSTVRSNEPRIQVNAARLFPIVLVEMFMMYGESGYVKLCPEENTVGLVVYNAVLVFTE